MGDTEQAVRTNLQAETKLVCSGCDRSTFHGELVRVETSWEDDDAPVWGRDEYSVVECQGCKNISFCQRSTFSEDWVIGKDGPEPFVRINQFPGPTRDRIELDAIHLLPDGVRRIYKETLQALEGPAPVLAGIGIRVIVEAVCKERKAKGRSLQNKIDSLQEQGLVTKSGAAILHQVRTLGNSAAHEVRAHTLDELNAAVDVVEYILSGVYIIPAKARVFSPENVEST